MKKVLLIIVILMMSCAPVWAATINVPADQPTIQAGIYASFDGDIVLLADGIYTGAGNYNVDFSGKSITVKSVNGPGVCIVDCQGLGRGFLVYNGETVTLEGLTVENGDAGENDGGAMYCNSSDMTVENCIFNGNTCNYGYGDGGAIFIQSSSSSFTNCTFSSNTATYGGALYVSPTNSSPDDFFSFTDCIFSSNNAADGGAVYSYSYNGHCYFYGCEFTSNSASGVGGAVKCFLSSNDFCSCTFSSNSSFEWGGAISFDNADSSTCVKCIFSDNSASRGGAINGVACSISIENCKFVSNKATEIGGAIESYNLYCPFTNCTFTKNEATNQGGAISCSIFLTPEDPITLRNCILWGNAASEGSEIYESEKPLVITYSNIQGGHTGTGNIDADPLFADASNDDLHLQETSPCINTGTSEDAPSDDLDSNFRPTGSGYDMGAYEYQGPIVIDGYSASPNTGKPSLAVDFSCTAHDDVNTITGYQWDFGDGDAGSTATGTTQHTYIIPGTFTSACTVTNDNSDQTTALTVIEVTNDSPIADAGPDQIIPGSSVQLDGSNSSDPDGSISSWEWTLTHTENPAYNRSASGEVIYLTGLEYGHYSVELTVTDNFGYQGTDEMFLSIAGSTGDVYSQEDLDQARQDGYLIGLDDGLEDSGNTIAGIVEENAEGDKVIEGPVIVKGCLIIE